MVPGDIFNPCHRTKSTGLRLRKVRIGRRLLAGVKSSNPKSTEQAWPDKIEDSETLILSTNLSAATSPPPPPASSSSTSSPEPHDQHINDDKTAAGKSIVDDDDVCVGATTSFATAAHGVISLIGRRREMEDKVTALPNLMTGHGYFGVYDGHGGFAVAEKCWGRLHRLVAEEMAAAEDVGGGGVVDWEKVMRMSFARMDREVCDIEEGEDVTGKMTAVVAVVGAEEIVVANCGDSKAVLCRGGVAVPLSRDDHKAERPNDRHGSRVLGVLATSRSIGDQCMRSFVISVPEVTVCQRTQSDEFLILASDGLWDAVPNDMACELVKMRFHHEQCRGRRKAVSEETVCVEGYVTHAASMLAEMAISRGSKDNVSIIVVNLTSINMTRN